MSEMNLSERDPDMLKLCAGILHDLGWYAQQGMIDNAFGYLRLMSQQMPDGFLMACANGLDAIQGVLKKKGSELPADTIHMLWNHSKARTP